MYRIIRHRQCRHILQDTHYKSAGKLGHGDGYKYAHDYKNHYVKQQYLPDTMKMSIFIAHLRMDMKERLCSI